MGTYFARFMTVFLLLLALACSGRTAAPPIFRVPVVCPPLDPDRYASETPMEILPSTGFILPKPPLPVELVVLGTSKAHPGKGETTGYEIRIEKVLYGAFKG